MTMMAYIGNKVPRRDSHLFNLKLLRGNVSSTDHVNKTKDDIIANPNSTDSQKYKQQSMNNSAMASSSGAQSKTTARSRSSSKSPSRATATNPQRQQQQQQQRQRNESDGTERIHNHNSNEPGLEYSSTTDHIRNKQQSSNINSSLESNASTTPFSQQEQRNYQKGMSDSERSMALELMISKPASDDMDYGNASQSNRSRAGSGDAASRYSQRSHRSRGNRTLRTEQSVGSTATSKGGLTSEQGLSSTPPPNLLNTRCQQWLALSLTHLISIASLHQATHSNNSDTSSSSQPSSFGGYYYTSSSANSNHPRRSSAEVAVLTLLSLAFTFSFAIGVGYFHGPFREYITTKKDESAPYVHRGRGGNATTSFQKLREFITVEQLLSLLLLVVLSISSGLILSPNDNNNNGGGGSYQYLAVAGSEIWNANLFYGTWVGLYGGAYLTSHSFFCPGDDVTNNHGDNHGMKLWSLMLFSSICASAAMLSVYFSSTCQGQVLAESSYCQSSMTSGMIMACSAILSLCCIASTKSNLGSKERLICVVSSSILLVLNSMALGVISSPSGAGAEVGSIFLVSWMTWIIGIVLWKGCIIESVLTSHEEEHRAAHVGSFRNLGITSKKKTRKRQRRRRSKRFNDVSSRSEATYNCTDEEGTTSDEGVEEGDIDSSDDGASGGTITHSEFNHCLESISNNTDDADDRRRHPLDPDGLLNRFHVSKTASDHYFGSRREQEDPDGVRKEELDHLQQENLNGRHATPRDATEYYETTSSRGGGLDKSSYSSAYYSGSDAVQVRAGSQEEVSTLGLTLDHTTLQGNSNQHEDPGGMRGGSMLPNGRDINNNNDDTPQRRNYVEEELSATNGGRRPILRDPSVYNDDNTGPDRQYLPKKDKTSTSPVANRKASQTSSNGVDMEWDFAVSPKPPTPTTAAKKAKKKTTTKTTAQAPLKTPAVPNATADTRRIPLRRRPSRDSLMSNCSPIEEGSQETSPGSLTGATNKSGSGVSGPMTTSKATSKGTSKATRGSGSAKNGKRSNTKNAKRGKTPPPPPRSEKQKQNRAAGVVQRDDIGVSSSIPGTVHEGRKKEARKQASSSSSSSETSHSLSTSSSDFDIVVSADHSVITELTSEGFDVPADYTSSSTDAAAKVDTEAAADCSTYMPKRNNEQKSSTSLFPSSTNSPPSLPPRLPLYNGSDNSPPSNHSTSPGDSENTPAGLRGQDVHPSVEAFLVSAMKNVRLSKGYSNMDEVPATANEEGSTGDHRHHQHMRHKSGGVNSDGSSEGRKRRGNDSGSGSEGREKRTQEGGSRRKRRQSTPKKSRKSRSKESARKKGEPDTDNARPKFKVVAVPTKDGK